MKDFSVEEIRRITSLAQACTGTAEERLRKMRNDFPDFWFRYPKLLEMSCQENMDMGQLNFMLSMMSSIHSNQTTLASANKEVQARLAGQYLPKEMMEAAADANATSEKQDADATIP